MTDEKEMAFPAFAKSLEESEDFFVTAEFRPGPDEETGRIPIFIEITRWEKAFALERLKAYRNNPAMRGGKS